MARIEGCCALLASLVVGTHAAECVSLGIEAPSVVTLMTSHQNTSVAWVVRPDCSVEVVSASTNPNDGVFELYVQSRGIERVVSCPPVERLDLGANRVNEIDLSGDKTTTSISLIGNQLASLDDIKFPSSLQTLDLGMNNFTKLDQITLPNSVTALSVTPNHLTDVKFHVPAQLEKLDLSSSSISSLEGLVFNDKITSFTCLSCPIGTIAGVRFPPSLKKLSINLDSVANFEIRESDVETVRKLVSNTSSSQLTTCADPTASQVKISSGFNVCVITDARFDAKYSEASSTTDSGSGSAGSAESSSRSSRQDSSSSSSSSRGAISTIRPRIPTKGTGESQSQDEGISAHRTSAARTFALSGLIGFVLAATVAVAMVQLCKRSVCADKTTLQAPLLEATQQTVQETMSSPGCESCELIDEDLIPFRFLSSKLVSVQELSRGETVITQLAKLGDRIVVTKQLLPELAGNTPSLRSFVNSIKVAIKFDHPQIVDFMGISYTYQRNFVAVVEYMVGGDLRSTLSKGDPSPRDWFEPSEYLKPKLEIAIDVALAMAYLHSFQPQIVHGNLSAGKVLLNERGDAKICCLGIGDPDSNPVVAAPEVLRGEEARGYADVFAFGLLLVEMDCCTDINEAGVGLTSTCPEGIRDIVASCLHENPLARPSFMEVHYFLAMLRWQRKRS